jgi:hypothetical protein
LSDFNRWDNLRGSICFDPSGFLKGLAFAGRFAPTSLQWCKYAHHLRFRAYKNKAVCFCLTALMVSILQTTKSSRLLYGLPAFMATLRSDHSGFVAKIVKLFTIFYATHIPGSLGILPSLDCLQYQPQPSFIQWPMIGSGIILAPSLLRYTNAAPLPVSITHRIFR